MVVKNNHNIIVTINKNGIKFPQPVTVVRHFVKN
jgi:hypothetical protein